jgi:hypothetical protein
LKARIADRERPTQKQMKGLRQTPQNQPGSIDSQPQPRAVCGQTPQPASLLIVPILLAMTALTLTSCAVGGALKGGKALTLHAPGGAIQQSLNQGDNPAQSSRQEQETVRVRTYTLPSGARIEDSWLPPQNAIVSLTNLQKTLVLPAPMPVTEREEMRAKTELGAAQKDTAREFRAKLSSLRGITWVGVAMFLLGLASLAWPPLKVIVGSVTTSAAILLGGLALMILPTLVVGNELLILGAVMLVVAAWFLAHRHGQLRGLLSNSSVPTLSADSPARNARSSRQEQTPPTN